MPPAEARVHKLSVDDVFRMVEAGVLGEGDRVELLDGVLVDVIPPGAGHSTCVAWLTRHFASSMAELEVRVQDLLLVEGGFVIPDLMVIEPPPRGKHPASAELVIEVSVTTHRHDRAKAPRYARADVQEYWLVDLPGRELTVHAEPGAGGYGVTRAYGPADRVSTSVGAAPVPVAELLGSTP